MKKKLTGFLCVAICLWLVGCGDLFTAKAVGAH